MRPSGLRNSVHNGTLQDKSIAEGFPLMEILKCNYPENSKKNGSKVFSAAHT